MNELYLSKDIYSTYLIEQTIVAFSNLADISFYDNDNHNICVFKNCIYSLDQTIKEFENYLIDLSNKAKC